MERNRAEGGGSRNQFASRTSGLHLRPFLEGAAALLVHVGRSADADYGPANL